MGNLNEIQKQTTQSYGDNSFTTTIKENTVEFDSAKDSFTFNDEVNVPSLKVNGQEITPTEPQVQADWNQTTSTESDYILNKPAIKAGQGVNSIVEGDIDNNVVGGVYAHAEGSYTIASGENSHAEGCSTTASGSASHAEGGGTTASGSGSHAEGGDTTASGKYSHAEGERTTASEDRSHAEGCSTTASGANSHAEGCDTKASGYNSHAEGYDTKASGGYSHSEGSYTIASGSMSHAEGSYTTANHKSQHVFGEYNTADPSLNISDVRGNYVEIVGNGVTSSARSNARTLDWSGNETLAGNLTIGGVSGATLKVEGGALKVSFNGGTTWLTVSAS